MAFNVRDRKQNVALSKFIFNLCIFSKIFIFYRTSVLSVFVLLGWYNSYFIITWKTIIAEINLSQLQGVISLSQKRPARKRLYTKTFASNIFVIDSLYSLKLVRMKQLKHMTIILRILLDPIFYS